MTIDLDQELSVSARPKVQVPPRIDGNPAEGERRGPSIDFRLRISGPRESHQPGLGTVLLRYCSWAVTGPPVTLRASSQWLYLAGLIGSPAGIGLPRLGLQQANHSDRRRGNARL